MDRSTTLAVKSIFMEAVELPNDRRAALLDSACGVGTPLRIEVEELLAAYNEADEFLVTPPERVPGGAGEPLSGAAALPDPVGSQVGPYRLIERIGEGGFGDVYLAEQEHPVRRRVAVKIIKSGMDTRQVIARFDAERQALALMDHPNIARVFDAGATATGRPYFVMEVVSGVPITRYADSEQLTVRQRLALFIDVCHAVQHAHQKGIIHRDLKPTNVLVTTHEGRPLSKVIDFGIAKATSGRLTDLTLHTEAGNLMGTPEYMSPEQASSSDVDVDTRSDVYALGVLLYQLLTGTLPLDPRTLRGAPIPNVVRMICEVEPPKPSTRLSALRSEPQAQARGPEDAGVSQGTSAHTRGTNSVAEVARRRGTDPVTLRRTLRGELDWIVMKCLEKHRGRRYATASDLAADVERYLRHEPVTAGPPTRTYRLRKFARRNRGLLSAVGAVFLALGVGLVATLWQAASARQEAAIARAILGFLNKDLFESIDPANAQGRQVTVREIVDNAARQIEGKFGDQPLVEAAIRATLGNTYRNIGEYTAAASHLERALDLRSAVLGEEHSDTLRSMSDLGRLYLDQARNEDAERLFRHVLDVRRGVQGDQDADTFIAMRDLAECYREGIRTPEALQQLEAAAAGCRRVLGEDHPETLTTVQTLAKRLSDGTKALAMLEDVWARRRRLQGDDHVDTLRTVFDLGAVQLAQAQYARAASLYEEALAGCRRVLTDHHALTLDVKYWLACTYGMPMGRYRESLRLHTEVYESTRAALGETHWRALWAESGMSNMLHALGRYDESEAHARTALRRAEELTYDPRHSIMFFAVGMSAANQLVRGRPAEAEALLLAQLDAHRAEGGLHSGGASFTVQALAYCYLSAGRYEDAERLLIESLQRLQEAGAGDGASALPQRDLLSQALVGQGRLDEAEALLAQVRNLYRSQGRLEGELSVLMQLAGIELERRQTRKAVAYAREAERMRATAAEHDAWRVRAFPGSFGAFCHRRGWLSDAETWLRGALESRREMTDPGELTVAASAAALAAVLLDLERFGEAEVLARECLESRERWMVPDYWPRHEARFLVGAALAGRAAEARGDDPPRSAELLAEAGPLLLGSAEVLAAASAAPPHLRRWCMGRVIAFCEAQGRPERAAEWRDRLEQAQTQPSVPKPGQPP